MRKAIWAEFYHVCSSNEEPLRQLCDDTWCKYREAQKNGKDYDRSQRFHLAKIIVDEIKPIFKSLSAESCLLEKCSSGKTQNVNESLNNVIWSIMPKRTFVTMKTLQYGTYDAINKFNDGNMSRKKLDERRVKQSRLDLSDWNNLYMYFIANLMLELKITVLSS